MTPQANQVAAWGDVVLVLALFTNILLKINFCVSFVYILTINWQTPKHVRPSYKYNCCKTYDAFGTVFRNFGFDCDTAVVVLIGLAGIGLISVLSVGCENLFLKK